MKNAREFLRGEADEPAYYAAPAAQLFEYFKRRWLYPRAAREQGYRSFDKESIRLSRCLDASQ